MKEQGNCTHAAAHKAAPAEGQPYSAVFSASGDTEPGVSSDFMLHIGLLSAASDVYKRQAYRPVEAGMRHFLLSGRLAYAPGRNVMERAPDI